MLVGQSLLKWTFFSKNKSYQIPTKLGKIYLVLLKKIYPVNSNVKLRLTPAKWSTLKPLVTRIYDLPLVFVYFPICISCLTLSNNFAIITDVNINYIFKKTVSFTHNKVSLPIKSFSFTLGFFLTSCWFIDLNLPVLIALLRIFEVWTRERFYVGDERASLLSYNSWEFRGFAEWSGLLRGRMPKWTLKCASCTFQAGSSLTYSDNECQNGNFGRF